MTTPEKARSRSVANRRLAALVRDAMEPRAFNGSRLLLSVLLLVVGLDVGAVVVATQSVVAHV